MKFSFEELHVWRQLALSLVAAGRYKDALGVFKEVIRLDTKQSINCLLAARLCYENLDLPAEGTNFSLEAKTKELANPSGLLGRCYLYIGIGYQLQSRMSFLVKDKQVLNACALENFNRFVYFIQFFNYFTVLIFSAVNLEPNDHLCAYYLGLHLALMGQINEALDHVRNALALRSESSSTLHLLALLLSANRQHTEALEVVEAALEEYPDCLNLMYVKAQLELHEDDGEVRNKLTVLRFFKNYYFRKLW